MSIGSLGVSAGNLASLQALVFSYIPYSPPILPTPNTAARFQLMRLLMWLLICDYLYSLFWNIASFIPS